MICTAVAFVISGNYTFHCGFLDVTVEQIFNIVLFKNTIYTKIIKEKSRIYRESIDCSIQM